MNNRKPRFEKVEDRVFQLLKKRRERGRRISTLWIQSTARRVAKELLPADEKFLASRGWVQRFARRKKLTRRSKTNVKLEALSERLPAIRQFHRDLRAYLKIPISPDIALDPKYGRYPPGLRINMDQVPLPFIQDLDRTWDVKGARRIWIKQPGSGSLSKRQATLILTISGGDVIKVKPGLIFRGTGQRISAAERAAWDPAVDVFFQKKAWFDGVVAGQWVKKSLAPAVEAALAALPAGHRVLLYADNLAAQTSPDFKRDLNACRVDRWLLPKNCTDIVQPVDGGAGRYVKQHVAANQNDWLDDDDNLEKWEGATISASDRRILTTKWVRPFNMLFAFLFGAASACVQVGSAFSRVVVGSSMAKYFVSTGCLMTIDGSDDSKIRPEGVDEKYSFEGDQFAEEIAKFAKAKKDREEAKADVEAKAKSGKEAKEPAVEVADEAEADSDADAESGTYSDEGKSDVDDDGVELDTIADAMPPGYVIEEKAPEALGPDLRGRFMLFCFTETGWTHAIIRKWYQKLYQGKYNAEMELPCGDRYDTFLRLELYGISKGAKPSSWVLLTEKEKPA